MSPVQWLFHLHRNLWHKRRVEQELDEELRVYFDQLVEEKVRSGLGVSAARRAALLEFGGMTQIQEEVRQVKTGRVLEEVLQDFRFGARTLRKNPAFAIVSTLVLALGIGITTAMFSVVYGMLWRPLPYPDVDRVAVVFMSYFPRDFALGTLCVRDYQLWQKNNHSFENPSLFRVNRVDIGGQGFPEQVSGAFVTSGFFSTLAVQPLLGRTFSSGEDSPAAGSLAVLSESVWRRRYAANFKVLGQSILVNGTPATIIGVMPAAVRFPQRETEIWTNLRLTPPTRYGPWFYRGIGRLKPGVTLAQAQADLNSIGLLMMRENSYYKRVTLPVLSLRNAILGTSLKPALLVLAGAVALVLLIAVVNVANLMLARATVRQREMALRRSLGAGRGRLVRQLLTESVLVAALGGWAGMGLAWGAIQLIRVWNPGDLPLIEAVRLDAGALAFSTLVSVITGILFGMAPALESARANLNAANQEGGRGGSHSPARGRMRDALVISQIAFSLVLLVGAGLLIQNFARLQRVTSGSHGDPRKILTMLISPGSVKYKDPAAGLAFYDELLRRARLVPGVEMASVSDSLPPDRQGDADSFEITGKTLAPGELNPIVSDGTASPDFFQTLGIPLVRGRYFDSRDTGTSTPVAIVSEGFARRFFPNQDALGKRIKQSGPGFGNNWMEIVGVVGNVKYLGLTVDTDPAYYMAFAQNYGPHMFLAVRTKGDAGSLGPALRAELQSIDRGVTIAEVSTMEQALNLSVSQPRFDTLLLAMFAVTALLLASAGIYGLMAYSVAQRTREIGVRMALGAKRSDVLKVVIGHAAGLAAMGVGLGLLGAIALSRLFSALLFGISGTDPLTFATASLGLYLVALFAASIPARRALRISPISALRCE